MRLFDDATLRTLERLSLWAESVRVGVMKGDRRSRRRGTSIEFADYRDYTQGDDLRRLDWNVLARLERPFIKLTEEEEDLAVHLLVDTSDSMNWPPGEDGTADNKLFYALRLVGALGTIALTSGDLVQVTLFDSAGQSAWGPVSYTHLAKTIGLLLIVVVLQTLLARLRIDQTVNLWWRLGSVLVLLQWLLLLVYRVLR